MERHKRYKVTLRTYTFMHGYSSVDEVISSVSLRDAKSQATRLAESLSLASTFKQRAWKQDNDGSWVRESDNTKSSAGHRDLIVLQEVDHV